MVLFILLVSLALPTSFFPLLPSIVLSPMALSMLFISFGSCYFFVSLSSFHIFVVVGVLIIFLGTFVVFVPRLFLFFYLSWFILDH